MPLRPHFLCHPAASAASADRSATTAVPCSCSCSAHLGLGRLCQDPSVLEANILWWCVLRSVVKNSLWIFRSNVHPWFSVQSLRRGESECCSRIRSVSHMLLMSYVLYQTILSLIRPTLVPMSIIIIAEVAGGAEHNIQNWLGLVWYL